MHLATGALFSPKNPVTRPYTQGCLPESPPNRLLAFQLWPNTSWRTFGWGMQGMQGRLKNTDGNRQVKPGPQQPKGVYFPVFSQRQSQDKVLSGKDLALNSFFPPQHSSSFFPSPTSAHIQATTELWGQRLRQGHGFSSLLTCLDVKWPRRHASGWFCLGTFTETELKMKDSPWVLVARTL